MTSNQIENDDVLETKEHEEMIELPTDVDIDDDDCEDYDPLDNRLVRKPLSYTESLINSVKSALGTGIWALGLAFSKSGTLFGVFLIVLISIIYTYCVHILISTSRKICKDLKIPHLTYPETVEKVFEMGPQALRKYSRHARIFLDIAMLFCFFSGCAAFVFVASTFQQILNHLLDENLSMRFVILLTAIPVLFVAQIRELKHLVPLSTIANFFILGALGITLYYIFNHELNFTDKPLIASPEKWPSAFSTIIFAINNIRVVLSIEGAMKKPQQYLGFDGVLGIGASIIGTLCAIVGFFSYVHYGSEIKGSVILNLPVNEFLSMCAKIFIGISVMFTIGFIFHICMGIIWGKLRHRVQRNRKNFYHILIRTVMTITMATIAIFIPDLGIFISLIGIIMAGSITILIPVLVNTIYEYPNYGSFKWKLIINCFLLSLYLVVLVSGTYENILAISRLYK